MLDMHGNLVTSSKALEKLTVTMFEDRLKTLKIKNELRLHQLQRENMCKIGLQEAKEIKTPDWTVSDFDMVLKQLKNNKSRDPLGFPNEPFKPVNGGDDLKCAILIMMNENKRTQKIPEILKHCNITSLYKNKGSRKEFTNYRGIFRVTKYS